jgi:excinuclease ABC subunit B
VASVSCIYGLGSPEAYYGILLMLEKGRRFRATDRRVWWISFTSATITISGAGLSRARGCDRVHQTYEFTRTIELFGDEIESLSQIDAAGPVRQTYLRLPICSTTPMSEETRERPWPASW